MMGSFTFSKYSCKYKYKYKYDVWVNQKQEYQKESSNTWACNFIEVKKSDILQKSCSVSGIPLTLNIHCNVS